MAKIPQIGPTTRPDGKIDWHESDLRLYGRACSELVDSPDSFEVADFEAYQAHMVVYDALEFVRGSNLNPSAVMPEVTTVQCGERRLVYRPEDLLGEDLPSVDRNAAWSAWLLQPDAPSNLLPGQTMSQAVEASKGY